MINFLIYFKKYFQLATTIDEKFICNYEPISTVLDSCAIYEQKILTKLKLNLNLIHMHVPTVYFKFRFTSVDVKFFKYE